MGDVADILGFKAPKENTAAEMASQIMSNVPLAPKMTGNIKRKKPKGMAREVFDLLGNDAFVPAMETNKPTQGFKNKRSSALRGKWIWAPFKSSARADQAEFYHWAKADVQYTDYPYAKFNVKVDAPAMYTDEEYEALLKSDSWTRSDTDNLLFLAHKYDLRWPVVVDRQTLEPPRLCEEMQARYYNVMHKLRAYRSGQIPSQDQSMQGVDLQFEKVRRQQAEYMFRRSRQDEAEEAQYREELKSIDAQFKKLRGRAGDGRSRGSAAAMLMEMPAGGGAWGGGVIDPGLTPQESMEATLAATETVFNTREGGETTHTYTHRCRSLTFDCSI